MHVAHRLAVLRQQHLSACCVLRHMRHRTSSRTPLPPRTALASSYKLWRCAAGPVLGVLRYAAAGASAQCFAASVASAASAEAGRSERAMASTRAAEATEQAAQA